ncbi:acetyl esterase/lipase [Sphingomonas zeicaulis]|uniref:alpha/beta hydrolase n=1 Tax=Sphingomonas zeicaulis TaxID=1632740 RepID=UPI003D1F53EE
MISIIAAVAARTGLTGPALLDLADRLTPGGPRIRRRISGAAYGSAPRQRLDLWRAAGAHRPQPVLVFFYGGGWSAGERRHYGFAARAFAALGFTVVVPDYRLVPAIHFPAFVEDAAAALRWVAHHAALHGGDPERILLAGHSAGAHIAVLVALDSGYARAAGIDARAIRGVAGLAGPYDFFPFDVPASIAAFARAPDPRLTQPIHFARRDAPPVWLATGTADTVVRPRNSQALAAALQAAGGSAVYRDYAGLDHAGIVMALARPFRGKAPVLAESADFLMRAALSD